MNQIFACALQVHGPLHILTSQKARSNERSYPHKLVRRGPPKKFERLREAKSVIGQALTIEQLRCLESVAGTKDAWQVAYYAETLASNTGPRGGEIKKLRLCNLDLEKRRIKIERQGTKSDAGGRLVQLNQAATIAACKLYVRAQSLGASDPEHYLLLQACRVIQNTVIYSRANSASTSRNTSSRGLQHGGTYAKLRRPR